MERQLVQTAWFQPCLLLLWISIGAAVRFAHLTDKPPWTDEFATLVFSLGHSFETVPLNQAIALETLMQPLQLAPQSAAAVRHYLFAEDVHPPLYFILANAWLHLFSADTGIVSLWLARSLPALLGVASIPAMFGLSWLTLRSPIASHLTAVLMAVSPFGVYLAQEARHYTLGVLWVIASLCCFVVAVRRMQHRAFPLWLGGLWVVVNALGIATHYFFMLSLSAMALALLGLAIHQVREDNKALLSLPWRRLYAVMLGTAIAAALWIPVVQDIRSRDITQWIRNVQPFNWLDLINPIAQSLAAWVTMLVLLPIESDRLAVAIASGSVMLAFILWAMPKFWQGWRQQIADPDTGGTVWLMSGVFWAAIALFFFISYVLRTDITRGARYSFVYFPAVILLLGTSLAVWKSKQSVAIVLLVGFLSSLTVVNNLGYRKYYRPDVLMSVMAERSQNPILIATTQNTLVQTGEMMGIGWQFLQAGRSDAPQFLLAHERQNPCMTNCAATASLQNALEQNLAPVDLWLVNFHAPIALDEQRCQPDSPTGSQPNPYISGYEYRLYRCSGKLIQ
ncbi:MAG: glycosyltransferase [Drouetiella hepatica Uher 2000/2452]|jgi:uncharacterized membrane protein|uniref:Glycosyltransferase n=1 Tax=Drouetiella hepatica Uher 2000/2452 TaxID=904376 RepID=A0A951QD10_9CYAN|nr:glycosyltransferase [Drouetiella hepatica Uher 2000/2452]